jgi:NAD(P)-dependent dehydrogenase (short-subunit alcohol dehydrogenase family)
VRTVHAVSTGVIAGLFPGQGSQTDDLRERVLRMAPELAEQAGYVTGSTLFVDGGLSV